MKKLVLQGFKSFKDKTSVYFDDGVTGIVGPNGCGKSNIVDALFWVMGEQSAKHLRGKSMKDLIFAGSSKYGPGAFAEVSLVLENTAEKHIHIGKKVLAPREIQISRKLYRNGDSEYRINGLPARLRDIQEIFMDTGAGAKSYSVIAQGEIDRLVQAKPEERRVIIEEVAGITKFKWRKRESLRKIEQTNLNLNRLKDLQSEIHKNLKLLERQAEKAEKARSLKKKIERADLVVHSHQEFDLLKNFSHVNNFIQEKKLAIAEWETKRQSLEVNLEQERVKKTELMDQIESERQELSEDSKLLAASEERLNYMRRTQAEKLSFVEIKVKENTIILDETQRRKEKWKELSEQRGSLEASELPQDDYLKLQSQVEEVGQRLELKEGTLDELRAELDQDKSHYFEIERKLFKASARAEELAQNLQDIAEEMDVIEQQSSHVSDEISQYREEVNAAKKQVATAEQAFKNLDLEVGQLAESKKVLDKEVHSMTKEVMARELKLESLELFHRNHHDQEEGVRELLKNFQESCLLFSGLIECEEQYIPAVQAALKTRLDSIILGVETRKTSIFEWLEEKELSADILTSRKGEFKNVFKMQVLAEVVTISKEDRREEIASLLQGIYIADKIDDDLLQSLKEEHFSVVVSSDGKRVVENLGNALRIRGLSGSVNDQTAIARKNFIQRLQTELASFRAELEVKRNEFFEGEKSYKEAYSKRDAQREKLFKEQMAFTSLRSIFDTKLDGLSSGESRVKALQERKEACSRERLSLLEREEVLNRERAEFEEVVNEKGSMVEEMLDEVSALKVKYTQVKEAFLVSQMEAQTFGDRVESLRQQIDDCEEQVSKNLKKLQENDDLVSKYEQELKGIEGTIAELQERNAESASHIRKREEGLSGMKDQLSELLIKTQEREDEVKKLTSYINGGEKEVVAKEAKREQIIIDEDQVVRNIFEKYQIDLRADLAKFLDLEQENLEGLADLSAMYYMDELDEQAREVRQVKIVRKPFEFHRKYGQELKDQKVRLKQYKQGLARIGEINWQAIDDYDRQKVRYQFLKQQEEELRASLVDLDNAISQIDEKSRMRFKVAFEEIDARFEKVFPIIFGGGSAKLKIIGNIDDPECGVDIIAQPPGKKMQNVNLMSGGEKALTAVSLIFSTFLVKPSPFCLLDEVDAPLDDANVGRFNELLTEMSDQSQFILITHNKKTMEFNDTLYGITMQEPGISTAVSIQLQ